MRMSTAAVVTCIVLVGMAAPVASVVADAQGDVTVAHDGEALTLHAAADQTVAGTADLAAGTTLSVRLRSSDASNPFIRSSEATVGDDGRFEATFDLADVSAGTNATASVVANGTQRASVPVEIVAEPTDSGDSPTEPTETPGQPGFGAAIALVALIAALVARRW